ncbi:hypothetical protein A2Z33_00585 [Candidatus Gottesmanbacteria bacterium RBG_16_52_11]|uniref:Uncharacterized protein n=1 Tax=Candidatus Gottesmanbacteria bacterium RBG_16_52_11 TaxID=1798374 RepID=A0A1F5YMU9_9BACT|nr:MAG: hypothetical protein A2Z33_00585 [Candidatus Gottesmanbacteria bacterium RBG_16_52_11]
MGNDNMKWQDEEEDGSESGVRSGRQNYGRMRDSKGGRSARRGIRQSGKRDRGRHTGELTPEPSGMEPDMAYEEEEEFTG